MKNVLAIAMFMSVFVSLAPGQDAKDSQTKESIFPTITDAKVLMSAAKCGTEGDNANTFTSSAISGPGRCKLTFDHARTPAAPLTSPVPRCFATAADGDSHLITIAEQTKDYVTVVGWSKGQTTPADGWTANVVCLWGTSRPRPVVYTKVGATVPVGANETNTYENDSNGSDDLFMVKIQIDSFDNNPAEFATLVPGSPQSGKMGPDGCLEYYLGKKTAAGDAYRIWFVNKCVRPSGMPVKWTWITK